MKRAAAAALMFVALGVMGTAQAPSDLAGTWKILGSPTPPPPTPPAPPSSTLEPPPPPPPNWKDSALVLASAVSAGEKPVGEVTDVYRIENGDLIVDTTRQMAGGQVAISKATFRKGR